MGSNFRDLVSPLSEVHHTTKKGKSESSCSNKMTNYSSDLSSFMPEHELVELLWENGQIVMQGQSNRTKKSSIGTEFAFDGRLDDKFGQNGGIDSAAHDLPSSVPSSMNDQEEDANPWLNYAIDYSIQNDYCSEFFSDLTGVHMASLSDTNSKDSQIFRSSPVASDPSRSRFNSHNLSENIKPRIQDVDINGDLNSTRFQKQDAGIQRPLAQSNSAGLMNFPHFSRAAALVKANLNGIDRLKSNEKSCTVSSTCTVESRNGLECLNRAKVDETELIQNSTVVDRMGSLHNGQASSLAAERKDFEKGTETVIASSSVCSGYDAVAASNDPKHKSKKRGREGEETGEESDNTEEELVAAKKPSSGRVSSGKRSRAAEVHNLSERRRRDRINEKMKALQELIPNCNKVDKASLLDEAIEYLKTLQLQVQLMSMGHGLFMTPMMFPAGMNFQHFRVPPISHFSQVGVGMGMIGMNGSPGLIPVPPLMPVTQFTGPSVPGVASFQGIPRQSLPVLFPRASLINPLAGFSPQNPLKVSDKDPSSSNNQQQQCINLEDIENARTKEPKGQVLQAVCPPVRKESKELNGRRDEKTVRPDDSGSKATKTRVA